MAVIVNDTFTVGANTDLASHTPDTGQAWVKEVDSTGLTNLQAETNGRMSASVGTASAHILYTSRPNPTNADYDVQISYTAGSPGGSDDPWFLVARFTDTSNYYTAGCYTSLSAADKKIFKKVGGTVTELSSGDSGTDLADTYKFELRGSTLKLYKNGAEQLSATDSALTAAGSAGFGEGNLWATAGDDINASWDFDNYSVTEVDATKSLLSDTPSVVMHILVR